MEEKFSFTIDGQPRPKPTPNLCVRNGFAKSYLPKEAVQRLRTVGEECQRAMESAGLEPMSGPVRVEIQAYLNWPVSKRVKRLDRMRPDLRARRLMPTTIPDCDNLAKLVCDGINRIAFADDRQVCELTVKKTYSKNPRTVVTVSRAEFSAKAAREIGYKGRVSEIRPDWN